MKPTMFYKVTVRPTKWKDAWICYFLAKPSHSDILGVIHNDQEAVFNSAANRGSSIKQIRKRLKLTRAVYDVIANYAVANLLSSVESQKIFIIGTEVGVIKVEELKGCNNTNLGKGAA